MTGFPGNRIEGVEVSGPTKREMRQTRAKRCKGMLSVVLSLAMVLQGYPAGALAEELGEQVGGETIEQVVDPNESISDEGQLTDGQLLDGDESHQNASDYEQGDVDQEAGSQETDGAIDSTDDAAESVELLPQADSDENGPAKAPDQGVIEWLNDDYVHVKQVTSESESAGEPTRTLSTLKYTVNYATECNEGIDGVVAGYMCYQFELPCTPEEASWATGDMTWMGSKLDSWEALEAATAEGGSLQTQGLGGYVSYTEDGKQIIKGKIYMTPQDPNPYAFPGSGSLNNVMVQVMSPKDNSKITPTFSFWMDHNDVVVSHTDETAGTITSDLKLNVKLGAIGSNYVSAEGSFDFSTGDETALNTDAGTVTGFMRGYGVTVQMYNPDNSIPGLSGCAVPEGPISFDLNFSATYTYEDASGKTKTVNLMDYGYTPLIYGYGKNDTYESAGRNVNGRRLPTMNAYAARGNIAPNDILNNPAGLTPMTGKTNRVWNGGTWSATQNGATAHFTVSDYIINPNYFPNGVMGDSGATTFWSPNANLTNLGIRTLCRRGCFATAKVFVVYPDTITIDGEQKSLLDAFGVGTINATVTDSSMEASYTSYDEGGNPFTKALDPASANENQQNTSDDSAALTMDTAYSGKYTYIIRYTNGVNTPYGTDGTTAHASDGKDTAAIGQNIGFYWGIVAQTQNSYAAAVGAANSLVKFDANAIELRNITMTAGASGYTTVLYAAKPDGSNWTSAAEMNSIGMQDLVYYSSRSELEADGKACVGVLAELRRPASSYESGVLGSYTFGYHQRIRVKEDYTLAGNVYPIIRDTRIWKTGDIVGYDEGENVPSMLEVQAGTAELAGGTADKHTYNKSVYNNGTYVSGHNGGSRYGDSLYVVPYQAAINKGVMQTYQTDSGSTEFKTAHNLDNGERVADYVIYPETRYLNGLSGEMTTTATIVDKLPVGLSYIPGSCYLGGTYTQAAKAGRQGTVTDGVALEPTVLKNADGTTTITWNIDGVRVGEPFGPIYYSCEIGNQGGTDDISGQVTLTNVATINTVEDNRTPSTANGTRATTSIVAYKNANTSLAKVPGSKFIESVDDLDWTLFVGNNGSSDIENAIVVDTFPANGDSKGSSFNSEAALNLASWQIDVAALGSLDGWKAYYTTDAAATEKTSEDYLPGDFAGDGWTELTISDDGSIPELAGKAPTAVVLVGTIKASKTVHVTMSIDPSEELIAGDKLVNQLSRGEDVVNSAVYVVSRSLEGIVWYDANADGQRGHGETDAEPVVPEVSIQLMKYDEAQSAYVDVDGATIKTGQIYNLNSGQTTSYDTEDATNAGRYRFDGLAAGTYAVRFTKGDYASFAYLDVTAKKVGSVIYDSDADGTLADGKLTNADIIGIDMPTLQQMGSNTYVSSYNDLGLAEQTIPVSVAKQWDDEENQDGIRPESVEVTLLASGQAVSQEGITAAQALSADNEWAYTWEGLRKYVNNAGANEAPKYANPPVTVDYGVDETKTDVITGTDAAGTYAIAITGDASDGFTVKNTHTPEVKDIKVVKVWNDANDQDGIRPSSVDVELFADGASTGETLTLTARKNWTDTWTGLPVYKSGQEIAYSVQEVESDVIGKTDGETTYATEVSYEVVDELATFTVTNTHTPVTISLSGSKTWNDNDNEFETRPESITVNLLANGVKVDSKTVTAEDNWAWTFTDKPKNAAGSAIAYTVSEEPVYGYDPAADGMNVANTPQTTTVSLTKTWDDFDNLMGDRPTADEFKAKLHLSAGGTDVTEKYAKLLTVVDNSDNTYTATWAGLPKVDKTTGDDIAYAVTEDSIDMYVAGTVAGSAAEGFTVTNKRMTGDLSVAKIVDSPIAADKNVEFTFTVTLDKNTISGTFGDMTFENGVATFNLKDGGTVCATGLPQGVSYTVTEAASTGFDLTAKEGDQGTISGTASTASFTNKLKQTEVSGTKVWEDSDYQGIEGYERPASVMVKAIGEVDGATVWETDELTVTEAEGWNFGWTGLPAYRDGKEIAYRVVEVSVPDGFKVRYEGGMVINTPVDKTDQIDPVALNIMKTDAETGHALSGALFEVHEGEGTEGAIVASETTGADGKATLTFSKAGTYTLVETAPAGYTSDPGSWTVVVSTSSVDKVSYNDPNPNVWTWFYHLFFGDGTTFEIDEAGTLNVANPPIPVDVKVNKVWSDDSDRDGLRPDSIEFQLYKKVGDAEPAKVDGKTIKLSGEGNEWAATFEKLPSYEDGMPVTYTVDEVEVPTGYEKSVSADGLTITNTHVPELTEVPVTKTWDDAEDTNGVRPKSIIVRLSADGNEVATATIARGEDGAWSHTFGGLLKYRDHGTEIAYTVAEDPVPGYEATVSGSAAKGYAITNTHKVEVITVDPPVKKTVRGEGAPTNAKFTFTFSADPASSKLPASMTEMPMPAGSNGQVKTVTVTGGGEYEFGTFEITRPGTYVYKMSEQATGVDGWSYDGSIYTVTYDVRAVDGHLTSTTTIARNGGAYGSAVPEFVNTYTKRATPAKTAKQASLPKTGDPFSQQLLIGLLSGGVAAIALGIRRRRRAQ